MRIGINVPNDLLKRVKTLQPDVNVSQVCREALEDLAATHELAVERVGSDGAVERVIEFADADELPLLEPDWVGYALDDARDWVSLVTPEGWDRFWYMYDHLKRIGGDVAGMNDLVRDHPSIKGYYDRNRENSGWFESEFDKAYAQGGYSNAFEKSKKTYSSVWLTYVLEARRKYLEYRDAKIEQAQAEREKAWQARPAPLLPPQLPT